ncbi:MAG TPA: ribosome silencing factor [Spirochaetota bacterium]|nr:ribosome silencing factor [Spirochaetota bacterium]
MTSEKKTREQVMREVAASCAAFIEEKKAQSTLVLDLREVNSYLDYFIITTGSSMVHCRALSRDIRKYMAAMGYKQRNRPETESGWIVMDFDEIVIHIFTEQLREYYQLERLWADAKKIPFAE